ncbi:MAG: DUF4097 family beta strand repeat-containing protein [Nitriliruptoraceae bacterium]
MTTTITSSPPASTPPPSRSDRSRLRRALAIAGLLTVGAGALGAAAWLVRDVDHGSTVVAAVDTIRFRGGAAGLTLVEADRDDIEVAWEAMTSPWHEAEVTAEVEDGVLAVTAHCPDVLLTNCSSETDITVPYGAVAKLDVEIAAGTVRATGTSAEVVATVNAGDVLLEEHHGTRAVLCVNAGEVEVDSRAVPRELDVLVNVGGIDITVPEADYDLETSVNIGTVSTSVREADDAVHRIHAWVDVGDVDVRMR